MRENPGRKQSCFGDSNVRSLGYIFGSAVPGGLDVVLTALTKKKLAQASVDRAFEDASDLLLGYVLGNRNDEP